MPGLARAVAASVRAPLAARMVVDEQQHAAGGAARAQVARSAGQQVDRIPGERGEGDASAARAVVVGAGDEPAARATYAPSASAGRPRSRG